MREGGRGGEGMPSKLLLARGQARANSKKGKGKIKAEKQKTTEERSFYGVLPAPSPDKV